MKKAIIYVDCKQMPRLKAEQYMKDIMDKFKTWRDDNKSTVLVVPNTCRVEWVDISK